jgi:hypothetical protein
VSRGAENSRDFGRHDASPAGTLRGRAVTDEEALDALRRYRESYRLRVQGWAQNNPIRQAERRRELRWARFIFFSKLAVGVVLAYAAILAFSLLMLAFAPTPGHSQTVLFNTSDQGDISVDLPDSVVAGSAFVITMTVTSTIANQQVGLGMAWDAEDPGTGNTTFQNAQYWSMAADINAVNKQPYLMTYGFTQNVPKVIHQTCLSPSQICGWSTAWMGVTFAMAALPTAPTFSSSAGDYRVWVPVTVAGCAPGVTPGPTAVPTPAPTTAPTSVPAASGGGVILGGAAVPNPAPTRVNMNLSTFSDVTVEVYTAAMTMVSSQSSHQPAGWSSLPLAPPGFHGSAFIRISAKSAGKNGYAILRTYF